MRLATLFIFLLGIFHLDAQVSIQLTATDATISTTCTDNFTSPDPLWSISVAGQEPVIFGDGGCFEDAPFVVFDSLAGCLTDIPQELEVCFRVWENDPGLFDPICTINEDCEVELCQTYSLLPGTNSYTLTLPPGGASEGTLSFDTEITGLPYTPNDVICDAIDLGDIGFGGTLGDASQGLYENFCATNTGEVSPSNMGGAWFNQAGVWFKFSTLDNLGSLLQLTAESNPEAGEIPIDLELAIFTTSDGSCTGDLEHIYSRFNTQSLDITLDLSCLLEPNTTYYVLVDGNGNGDFQGRFGLEMVDGGFVEAGNLRCDFLDLGVIPPGGSAGTSQSLTNYCADDSDDPFAPAFVTQSTVWFAFTPPPTGHVIIEGISNPLDPIGIQLAAYRSTNNTCTGFFVHLQSEYSSSSNDQSMVLQCLDPDRTYYIMIDGDGANNRGAFDLMISDGGDIVPRTTLTETICAGDVFTVGGSNYTLPGTYADTLSIPGTSCDSIVNLELSVLDEIVVTAETSFPATGIGNPDGQGTASAIGGTGTYTFTWSSGQTGDQVSGLIGDSNVCVTATDEQGCTGEFCFTVEYVEGIIPAFVVDTIDCKGGTDGSIELSAIGGLPPFEYQWNGLDNPGLSGGGTLTGPDDAKDIIDLAAGTYSITISDAVFDTIFTVNVPEPEEVSIELLEQIDAQCYQDCNGALTVQASGGNGGYTYSWTGQPSAATITNLCAGTYELLVTDSKGCTATASYTITEPEEFIATAFEQQSVSCFGGSDGIAGVTTNFPPHTFQWENGFNSPVLMDLPAGFYLVTVTDNNGCTSVTEAIITEPDAPLEVSITEIIGIRCGGEANGVLGVNIDGPGESFTYQWANGTTTDTNEGLEAGNYAVTVTNERGCVAEASYQLDGPAPLAFSFTETDLTCLDAENDGLIVLDTILGGTTPYTVEVNGESFGSATELSGLTAGSYELRVVDGNGCEISATASILPPPELLVELSGPESILLGDAVEISALSNSSNAALSWEVSDDFSFTDSLFQDEVSLLPFERAIVTVTAYDSLTFCTATATQLVEVRDERRVFVPNAFSPNGDGQNDVLRPYVGSDVERILAFRVFDRYGAPVYEIADLAAGPNSPGWDGRFRGQELDPGVFVWMAELLLVDGRREVLGGDVTLLK